MLWEQAAQSGVLQYLGSPDDLKLICLVYVNTLLIQRVLAEPRQFQQLRKENLRALTPLIYSHVIPHGLFRLDLTERMRIEEEASA